jgi:hypothetical protein
MLSGDAVALRKNMNDTGRSSVKTPCGESL